MRAFTDARSSETLDELWLVEHPPVYTMGLKGRGGTTETIGGIPVVYTDRGGDMTYHGPGQIVLYTLLDLHRHGLGIKTLVHTLEQSVVDYLAPYRVKAQRQTGAPGVYVDGKKIASLGLRVRGPGSYHGLALNVDMDLSPFTRIDPCGYSGMEVTQLVDLGLPDSAMTVGTALVEQLAALLGYNSVVNLPPTDFAPFSPKSHE